MSVTIYLTGLEEPLLGAGPPPDLIQGAAFLHGAPEEMLRAAADLLVPVAALPGEWIVAPHMPARGLYVLAAGTVELYAQDGQYLLTICGKGSFGEDALSGRESGIGAACAATSAHLWLLDRKSLSRLHRAGRKPRKQDLLWI
jgi:CRP-like cAMP-binding protein